MSFEEMILDPSSKKITLVEIDSPLKVNRWINFSPGIWFTNLSPGSNEIIDDYGETGYWEGGNDQYYNIQSLNVNGELYVEVSSVALVETTNKSWFYDIDTTEFYVHFEDWKIPEFFFYVSPGAVVGFTNLVDLTCNNYFENIYYEPLLTSVPNLSKKKDALFFGILQYQGGSFSFKNENGYFDDFADRDLYGQPARIKLSFEGLPYSEALNVYTARVEDFENDFGSFNLNLIDIRKLLSRNYPINKFNKDDYPNIDDKLVGSPIPIAFDSVIKSPVYKISPGVWKFCDTEFLPVDSGIIVYNPDDTIFSHGGIETDGTFTGVDTNDDLTVSFSVSSVKNGLDIISFILETYENAPFNSTFYDVDEWNESKISVIDSGLWIGKGALKSSTKIIEQICKDNQGIFDVLRDGRFSFRLFDPDKDPEVFFEQDELLADPIRKYESEEYLSSVIIQHSYDRKNAQYQDYNNTDFEDEVYARYRQYKEKPFPTSLMNIEDSIVLSNRIMDQSKFIYPTIDLKTKTQKIDMKILDNAVYEYKRQAGVPIINNAVYQVLQVSLNLTKYEISSTIKYIKDFTAEEPTVSAENGAVYGLDVYGIDVYGL